MTYCHSESIPASRKSIHASYLIKKITKDLKTIVNVFSVYLCMCLWTARTNFKVPVNRKSQSTLLSVLWCISRCSWILNDKRGRGLSFHCKLIGSIKSRCMIEKWSWQQIDTWRKEESPDVLHQKRTATAPEPAQVHFKILIQDYEDNTFFVVWQMNCSRQK